MQGRPMIAARLISISMATIPTSRKPVARLAMTPWRGNWLLLGGTTASDGLVASHYWWNYLYGERALDAIRPEDVEDARRACTTRPR